MQMYRGWQISKSELFGDFVAQNFLHPHAWCLIADTVKELRAKIRKHVERWGW